ncbi:MAG: type II and III secretion system protein family protein [Hyphomicrobiales bacterium]|nr:type II and III secretion system protein family protein [Hyphomicrobiales bacterium]
MISRANRASALRIGSALLLAVATPAAAEPRPSERPPSDASAPSASVERRSITVTLHETTALSLDEDVADVILANPEMIEAVVRTPRRIYVTGLRTGQTSALLVSRESGRTIAYAITVAQNLSAVSNLINRLVHDAHVRAEAINGDVALTGGVRRPADALRAAEIAGRYLGDKERVMNLIDVALPEQVLLKVTVAEVQRGAIKRLGVDITQAAARASGLRFKGVSETAFPVSSQWVPGSPGLDAETGALSSGASGAAVMAVWKAGSATIGALMEAMERDNLVRTLAEPTLASMSGETAEFLAGGELPIPVSRDKENVSVEWKRFGVGLSFTPMVLTEGRISLKIATEVSDLSSDGAVSANGFSIPAIKVRRASSTVELPSGGALVMAGLISKSTQRSSDGAPGLRQLPILGELFESEDFAKSESELVIIVTPYLAKAAPPSRLALPTDSPPKPWRAEIVAPSRARPVDEPAFSFFDR